MTCIVGVEHNNKVFIGGDLQGSGWNHKIVHTQPKVFNKRGVIFGYTTSYRFGQILEHNLTDPVVPENPDEIYRWLVTAVVPDIRNILKENGYGGTTEKGGNALIGVRGQLWEIQDDFSVLRSVNGYAAVGSGQEYANASLSTAFKIIRNPSQEECMKIMKLAIYTAGKFCPTVGQDSVIISTT
jgi:ATP-dependent protease HslVU (ClpYQ) peptidase subunit